MTFISLKAILLPPRHRDAGYQGGDAESIRDVRTPQAAGRRHIASRGFAVIIVLAMLAITISLSYAMMRSASTSDQIQTNFFRGADSRQAAYAGLSFALRKMQLSSWAGIDSRISQDLGGGQSFVVTFATGDPALAATDSRYPYRVTLTSKGTATDLSSSTIKSTSTVVASVQLIPRKMADEPAGWTSAQPYTVFQWGTGWWEPMLLDVPVRIEGPVYSQNSVYLGPLFQEDTNQRPFAGQIDEMAIFGKALSAQQMSDLASGNASLQSLTANGVNSPISHWRLNESSGSLIARDELGYYNGLYDGANPGGSAGPTNGGSGSATFDGYNDHIHLGNVVVSGNSLSIVAWIKPSILDAENGRIISKTSNGDFDYWMLSTYKSGTTYRLRFRLTTRTDVTDTLIASSGNLSTNQWTLVGATYDGAKMRLYKDGVLVGSMDKDGNIPNGTVVPVSLGNTPPASPRARLLRDWNAIRTLTGVDNRPVTGPIHAPQSLTTASERSLFTDELQATWNNVTTTISTPLTHPGQVLTYQLYPGGKTYSATVLNATLENIQLKPDTLLNPLGVCYRNGSLAIGSNVKFTGVLIVNGSSPDVDINGNNIQLQAATIPAVDGSSTVTQLPVAMILDDCNIHGGSTGSIDGAIAVWDQCTYWRGAQAPAFTVNGKIISKAFYVLGRSEWEQTEDWWTTRAAEFLSQLAGANPNPFFPNWLQTKYSFDPQPHLRIQPFAGNTVSRWHNWSQPVFTALPSDGGLRWEIVSIREVR